VKGTPWFTRRSETRNAAPRFTRGAASALFLHLQRAAVKRRHHGLHVAVVRDVGVRTAIRLGKERRGRDPLGRKRAIDGGCRSRRTGRRAPGVP